MLNIKGFFSLIVWDHGYETKKLYNWLKPMFCIKLSFASKYYIHVEYQLDAHNMQVMCKWWMMNDLSESPYQLDASYVQMMDYEWGDLLIITFTSIW